jgi:hypothetical protein
VVHFARPFKLERQSLHYPWNSVGAWMRPGCSGLMLRSTVYGSHPITALLTVCSDLGKRWVAWRWAGDTW